MTLDTFSNNDKIYTAVKQVRLPAEGGRWVLLGYVNKGKRSHLMTVNVKEEGTGWSDLLDSFEEDKIQYGYAKIDYEGRSKLFLIHWVGKEVGENVKTSFMPHLNEIRNLIREYDFVISSMNIQDVHCKVENLLSRKQSIDLALGDDSDYNSANARPRSFSTLQRKKKPKQKTVKPLNKTEMQESFSQCNLVDLFSGTLPKVKIAIIGSVGVGKTQMYVNYNAGTGAQSVHNRPCTIGVDYMSKVVRLAQHKLTLEIWDTAGQERYASLNSFWTRNAKVVICVYDIADAMSYNEVPKHLYTAKEFADPRAIFFLVGNKADLVHRREVQEVDAQRFASQHGMSFMECSGLTGLNISKLFENITKHAVFTYHEMFTSPKDPSIDVIRLTDNTLNSRKMKTRGCQQCKA